MWRAKRDFVKQSLSEAREIIVQHEDLINKLSEQNDKYRDYWKSRKSNRAISNEIKGMIHFPKE